MVLRPSTLREDIGQIFSQPTERERAEAFLSAIRENWRQNNTALSRSVTSMLVLGAIFELLVRTAIDQVSIGPFEIKDLSLVRISIPPIISYLFYESGILTSRQSVFRAVHDMTIRTVNQRVFDAGLNLVLSPEEHPLTYPNLWGFEQIRVVRWVNSVLTFATVGGILIFEGYAYYVQFLRLDIRGPIIWVSLTITVLLLCAAVGLIIGERGSAEQRQTA
jgi:hypothetical protein